MAGLADGDEAPWAEATGEDLIRSKEPEPSAEPLRARPWVMLSAGRAAIAGCPGPFSSPAPLVLAGDNGSCCRPGLPRSRFSGEEFEGPTPMPLLCDVALPVPMDKVFTYRVDGPAPVVGGRVLVPFREKRLSGVVLKLHEAPASPETRTLLRVLDAVPVIDADLLKLARWIAQYYIAPIGEVLRMMLPLAAEFRRVEGWRITDAGLARAARLPRLALVGVAQTESNANSRRPARKIAGDTVSAMEGVVLNYLADRAGETIREATLRAASSASKEVLRLLHRKKLIVREDLSEERNSDRTVKFIVLTDDGRKVSEVGLQMPATGKPAVRLNGNQQAILRALASAGGRLAASVLHDLPLPSSTLATLARRRLVEIAEEPAEFAVSGAHVRAPLAFVFTSAQKVALLHINQSVEARRFSASLLHGVTGSGKTAVYLAAMQKVLADGRGAIMLVPEIGLTPAAAAQLHIVFGDKVAILHSGLSDDERADQWKRIRRGDARVVVGTRSAVFAPVDDLALIVVDEEHDHSYKQEETPRYHARDVAVVRARMSGAAVVLGSATPSLESYYNAQRGRYALVRLPDRVEQRPLPEVELIDMRREYQETGRQLVISRRLGEEIAVRLERGEQAIILLNRRGFSAFVMCRACGETVQCRNCAVAMTYHKRVNRLECHYCGFQQPAPRECPKCGSDYVQFLGSGSEKLEELLHAQFPQARIGRLDRDTVRGRHDFERMLNAMNAGEIDLLVGTQMIAKGHDIHGVTLVGVVGADAALAFPDFRAAERTFQLLTQVAGRAGRGESPGRVVLQTYFADHYAVQFASSHDFQGFCDKEMRYRSAMQYPPFVSVANIRVHSERLEEALKYSGLLGEWFRDNRHEGVRVLGPAVAPIARLKSEYRYHLLLKSGSREKLNSTLRAMLEYAGRQKIPWANLVVDVDAVSLL